MVGTYVCIHNKSHNLIYQSRGMYINTYPVEYVYTTNATVCT